MEDTDIRALLLKLSQAIYSHTTHAPPTPDHSDSHHVQENRLVVKNPWSGDHCMDSIFLPGVFLSNRTIRVKQAALQDMAPSILDAFGVPVPKVMTGKNVFNV